MDRPVEKSVLRSMVEALYHRGPDEAGILVRPEVGLGNARLGIIDIRGGRQPIGNEDGTIQVVLNGEVFNYRELREDLEARGHRFRTRSDTEVLVHLYEEEDLDFPRNLNGQFSIALWDGRKQRLVLIRDPVGITPLYYTEKDGRLIFASEVKALAQYPAVNLRPDLKGLAEVFTFWSTVPPRTVYENIRELPPGHLLVAGRGRVGRSVRWCEPHPCPAHTPLDTAEAVDAVRTRLREAVRLRLRADIPVGAYISGGLDSSIIAALAAEEVGSNLQTFSITFTDPSYDEAEYQAMVARRLGTHHRYLGINDEDVVNAFPETVYWTERPLLRSAPVPLYLLSRMVRKAGCKVVLTGEGADEGFAGYNIFKEAKIRRWWAKRPESTMRPALLSRLYPYQGKEPQRAAAYWKRFFGRGLTQVDDPYYSHHPRWTNTSYILNFLGPDASDRLGDHDPAAALPEYLDDMPPAEAPLSRAQYLEMKLFLNGYLISSQGDRMLMANSVEGRFPFLDPEVLAFAGRLPERLRLPGLREKALLKRAFDREVPAGIRKRNKQPYRAPGVQSLLAGDALPDWVGDMLSRRRIEALGLFDFNKVEALTNKCRTRILAGNRVTPREDMAILAILSSQILFGETFNTIAPPPATWWEGAEKEHAAIEARTEETKLWA